MRGLLSDLSFLGVLDLIHATRQTGILHVQAHFPYTVTFLQGEIVSGGILDWFGEDALVACPVAPEEGKFEFQPKLIAGHAMGPYHYFVTEWARMNDEWEEICSVIGSPSRIYRGDLPLFDEERGRSVRAAARKSERPIFEVAKNLAEAVQQGRVEPVERYAWFGLLLRINPNNAKRMSNSALSGALNGERNLGCVVAAGHQVSEVRHYLYNALQKGLRFTGSGWVLRDLTWEMRYDASGLRCVS